MSKSLLFILFLYAVSAQAQSSFGGYSNQIHWHQINTDQVRVIFPDSLADRAQRVANIIHYMNDNNVGLLGKKRHKFDIILRTNDAISNGYAQIAPLKSEFFMQAPQKTFEESSVDWTDQLAIHEYRHINQFLNSKRGVGNLIYWLFGDYGWGGIIGTTAPAWFVEGDATINETALSSGGRGRVPSFSAFQRAQQEAKSNYSYMKAMNGSYKDLVPNHYNTGYLILSEMRRNHDNADFDEITRQATSYKGVIYPFRKAVKRVTGTSIREHYFNASEKLQMSIPQKDASSIPITKERENNVVQYDYPLQDGDGLYFSYGDRRDIRGIYKYSTDGEHKLIVYRGLMLDAYFDKHENLFVWSELQRDIRRGNQNFSNLILYDARTNTKKILGRGEAYFSPSFGRDGKNLIFVNAYKGTTSGISMLNLEHNATLDIITSSTKQFLYPVQGKDGSSIYAIVKEKHFYAICKVELDGKFSLMTDWDDVVFGPMKVSGDHLIFQANYTATDQVYALNVKDKSILKISDDAIGMYNPSNYENGKVIAVRPHAQGFLLHEIATDLQSAPTIRTTERESLPYYLKTDHLEPNNILNQIPDSSFSVSKYPRNLKIFRPHSWLLSADGTEFAATLYSNNIINNISIQPSYRYNNNVEGSFLDVAINYGRWFPIYQLSYTSALPRMQDFRDRDEKFEVSQHFMTAGFVIPLNLTQGVYSTSWRFTNSISQIYSNITNLDINETLNIQETTLTNIASFSHTRFRALQNLLPRWGYTGQIRNRYRFNDGHNGFNMSNDIYLPGFSRNHGFKIEVDYASQNEIAEDRFRHVDVFNYAHGFRSLDYDQIWSFNTNYALPLVYPDWGFADFLYFKRIHSVMFHNYNNVRVEGDQTRLQSMGADLLFDVVFNNTIFSEITVGFRNAYMIGPLPEGKTRPYHFEFIVDIPAF